MELTIISLTRKLFDALVQQSAFLEHATVYGNSYGTLRSAVETSLESGKSILLEIDHQGAQQVRQLLPDPSPCLCFHQA